MTITFSMKFPSVSADDLEDVQAEWIEQITAALDAGASKASVCRSFKVPRSTLIGTLDRIGWTGPVKA